MEILLYSIEFTAVCTHISDCCILLTLFLYSGSRLCPVDNIVFSMEQIYSDTYCERQISNLETRCSNKHQGCEWTGPFRLLEVCASFYFHV